MMPPPLNTGSRPVKDIEPRVSAESPMLAPLASKSRVPQMPKITARPSPTLQALPDELLVHIISCEYFLIFDSVF